jgi:hypothetical protein
MRRTWLMLALGLATAASLTGLALAQRGSTSTSVRTASWHLYPQAEWSRLTTRTGLAGVHVVAATTKLDGTPVALVAGRRQGRTCFVPVDGFAVGRVVCRLDSQLTLFRVRDGRYLDLLGIARRDVAGVAQETTLNGRPNVMGASLVPAGDAYVFAGGSLGGSMRVVARGAQGRVLARIWLR